MAQSKNPNRALVAQVQQQIFNKLCTEYRRSRQAPDFGVRADDVRRDLAIPETLFALALKEFTDASGERVVEVFIRNRETHLGLSDSARENLRD